MSGKGENIFEIKIGRIYSPSGSRRMISFAGRVKRAAGAASLPKNGLRLNGNSSAVREQFFSRRVIVKVNLVKMGGQGAQTQSLHLDYIARDNAAPDNERGSIYDKHNDIADADEFQKRGKNDRHQFRIIVSAEDGKEITDLRSFTRDIMAQMEEDLGTRLDWVAANHYDTATPHTHIVIGGKNDDGKNLVIPRQYISYGMRERAEEMVTLELGPINQYEAGVKLANEVTKERFTQLDRALLRMADANVVDISTPPKRATEWTRRLDIARLKTLSRMGLAYQEKRGVWHLDIKMENTLRSMGERGDILKAYHHALEDLKLNRRDKFDVVYDPHDVRAKPLTGKILAVGSLDDINDNAYLIIDTTEGEAIYVKAGRRENIEDVKIGMVVTVSPADIEPKQSDLTIDKLAAKRNGDYSPAVHQASDQGARPEYIQAHIRRLEALRRAGHVTRNKDGSWKIPHDYLDRAKSYEKFRSRAKPVDVNVQSRLRLKELQTTMGRTWLDVEIMADNAPVNDGFGSDVQAAKSARTQYLVQQGILENENTPLGAKHLDELERRDLACAAKKLSATLGKAYLGMEGAARINGTYREAITRPSGKYAIIERAKDFSLVPWRDVLERNRGKAVSGIMRGNSISWTLNKGREIS